MAMSTGGLWSSSERVYIAKGFHSERVSWESVAWFLGVKMISRKGSQVGFGSDKCLKDEK